MSPIRFIGFLTTVLVSLFSYHSLADDTSSGDSSFDPSFFTSVGLTNWSGFTSDAADAYEARVGAGSTVTHDEGSEVQLVASVGMRPTNSISVTLRISDLPVVDSTISGGAGEFYGLDEIGDVLDNTDVDDALSDTFLNTRLSGWNAQLAIEYAIPLGEGGLRAGVQAGLTQSRLKVREVIRSNFQYEAGDPNTFRARSLAKREWQTGGFIGIGVNIPITLIDDNTELSFLFTNALNDDDWGPSQSLTASLVYNFQ